MTSLSLEGGIVVRPGEKAFDQWMRYYYLSRAGMWLIAAGGIGGIWAFWRYMRNRDTGREAGGGRREESDLKP